MIETVTLKISGKDTFRFLQGQFTYDINKVKEIPHPSALCNTKGRVIASFEIYKKSEDYYVILPAVMINIFLNALKKYAQFSAVSFEKLASRSEDINLLLRIQQKNPVILPETSEKFTPHELNYPELGYVSFTKGCYRGQEIVARMHYLGKLKKQLIYKKLNNQEEIKGEIINIIKKNKQTEVLMLAV